MPSRLGRHTRVPVPVHTTTIAGNFRQLPFVEEVYDVRYFAQGGAG